LIVFSPKSLLRAKQARSPVDDLATGRFVEVLDDPFVDDPDAVQRVVFVSGKIAFDAMARRDKEGAPVAVVRIEQLYPWPADQVEAALARYAHAQDVIWLQEEPENMGAWTFVRGRLEQLVGDDYVLDHVSRAESGSPAAGSATMHQLEQDDLLTRAIKVD
jgi:2-oxoglutarate dehydrogenase E1 component